VVLTLLFLAPLFSDLPLPVLAALIIEAVVMGMMDVPEMRRLYRVKRFDFWIAIAAIVGTLLFGVLVGVLIGIVLSLLRLISVTTRPAVPCWVASLEPRYSGNSMITLATSSSLGWRC
jgi:MFS superfamily sulfate permease-like transporter